MPKLGHMVADTVKIQIFSKGFLLSDSDYVKKRRDLHCFRHKNPVCGLDYKAIFGIAGVRSGLFTNYDSEGRTKRPAPGSATIRPWSKTTVPLTKVMSIFPRRRKPL